MKFVFILICVLGLVHNAEGKVFKTQSKCFHLFHFQPENSFESWFPSIRMYLVETLQISLSPNLLHCRFYENQVNQTKNNFNLEAVFFKYFLLSNENSIRLLK